MEFRNPANNYVESKTMPALWCELFGPLYFLASGIWVHALVMVLVAIILLALFGAPGILLILLMDVCYCFAAPSIVEGYYLGRGWLPYNDNRRGSGGNPGPRSQALDTKTCPYCAETVRREAIKCKHCGSDLAAPIPNSKREPELTEKQLMQKYQITFDGEVYWYKEYRYSKVSDAINYARRVES